MVKIKYKGAHPCAGYATRLYPLTLTQPKPLLPVAGKPMIDYVMDNLVPIRGNRRGVRGEQREVRRAVFAMVRDVPASL
jgi:choline kinase